MAYIKICDLCGKPIQGEPQKNYKIKERWSSWLEFGWETIDAHEECVKKLYSIPHVIKPKNKRQKVSPGAIL